MTRELIEENTFSSYTCNEIRIRRRYPLVTMNIFFRGDIAAATSRFFHRSRVKEYFFITLNCSIFVTLFVVTVPQKFKLVRRSVNFWLNSYTWRMYSFFASNIFIFGSDLSYMYHWFVLLSSVYVVPQQIVVKTLYIAGNIFSREQRTGYRENNTSWIFI